MLFKSIEKAVKIKKLRNTIKQILSTSNYDEFKKIMIQRNKELDEEAQKIYKSYHEKRDKAKFNETKKSEKAEKPKTTKQQTAKPSKEEEEMLKLAIQESLVEEEDRQKAIAFEKEMLEVSI
jgi:hypothetical protein